MPSRKWQLLAIPLIYLLAWYVGCVFTYCGFVQPDTCWLLKMGQIIVATHAIPVVDPFSFSIPITQAASGQPTRLIVYQWLAEAVFFLLWLQYAYKGLLIFGALISVLTFLSIPLRTCIRANARAAWSVFAVIFLTLSVGQRFQVRPEIFSCLFLSIWLAVLQRTKQSARKPGNQEINLTLVCALFSLMVVWCNMHTGFVIGIGLLAIYTLASVLDDSNNKRPLSCSSKTLVASLVMSVLATLLNPYGIGLWLYIPHLFFSPINAMISELNPLSIASLFQPLHWPFLALMMLCYGGILYSFLKRGSGVTSVIDSPIQLANILIVQIAAVLPFYCSRLISLSSIILVIESANCMESLQTLPVDNAKTLSWLNKKSSWLVLELAVLMIAFCSVNYYAGNVVPIRLPQATHFFTPPIDAMKAFSKIYHGGRIFSSAEISDMIDLFIAPKNGIFLDTRYDAFTPKIVDQHKTILLGGPGWKELLDLYKIDWVFVENNAQICSLLVQDPRWLNIYHDQQATIFRRIPQLRLPTSLPGSLNWMHK